MPITLQISLSTEQIAQLRQALTLTQQEIDAVAAACVDRLKAESLAQAAALTVKEFATQARLTVSHVHALIRKGKLEAVNPAGGDRRITAAAAARYFAGASNGNG